MGIRTHIIEEAEQRFGHIWKVMAVRGLLGIAFGVILLGWPGIGLTALIALFGAVALLSGIATIGASASLPVGRGSRAWLAIDGLLAIAVAVVVLIWPDLTARALLFAIAAIAVSTGVLQLGLRAFALPVTGTRSLLLMLGGVVSTLFGIVMFAHPGAGALALLSVIAAFAIVTGAMQVTLALELRRLAGGMKRDERPRMVPKAAVHG